MCRGEHKSIRGAGFFLCWHHASPVEFRRAPV
jgi:hypothetical protein